MTWEIIGGNIDWLFSAIQARSRPEKKAATATGKEV
jgi:hypothetical protein